MAYRIIEAVLFNSSGHKISRRSALFRRISQSSTDAGFLQHRNIITAVPDRSRCFERNLIIRSRITQRRILSCSRSRLLMSNTQMRMHRTGENRIDLLRQV